MMTMQFLSIRDYADRNHNSAFTSSRLHVNGQSSVYMNEMRLAFDLDHIHVRTEITGVRINYIWN